MICHNSGNGAAEPVRLLGIIDPAGCDPAWERVCRAAARAVLPGGARGQTGLPARAGGTKTNGKRVNHA